MIKAKYFRFVGGLELVCFVIGLIIYIVQFAKTAEYLDDLNKFINVLIIIIIIVVGPALGVLFLTVAENIEIIDELNRRGIEVERRVNKVSTPVVVKTVNKSGGSSSGQETVIYQSNPNAKFKVGDKVKILRDHKNMFGTVIPSGSVGTVTKTYSSSIQVEFDLVSSIQVKNEDAIKV